MMAVVAVYFLFLGFFAFVLAGNVAIRVLDRLVAKRHERALPDVAAEAPELPDPLLEEFAALERAVADRRATEEQRRQDSWEAFCLANGTAWRTRLWWPNGGSVEFVNSPNRPEGWQVEHGSCAIRDSGQD